MGHLFLLFNCLEQLCCEEQLNCIVLLIFIGITSQLHFDHAVRLIDVAEE